MKRFEVTFERSAVQIMSILVDAADEKAAKKIAKRYMDAGGRDNIALVQCSYSGDNESVWEHMDTEERKRDDA